LSAKEYALAREFPQRAAPERPSARLDLAVAVFYTEGPEPALQVLEAIPKEETTGDVLVLKANVLDAAGQASEAEKTLDEGLRHPSVNPRMAQQAVVLLLRRDRKADALRLLEKAMRANPEDPDLPLTRAVVLGLMNQTPAAEKALREIESACCWNRPAGPVTRGRSSRPRLHWDRRTQACAALLRAWSTPPARDLNAPA
jgi:predicted Zn-dependent protease